MYFVEPVSGHPSYHVQRNIVVREPSAEIHKEKNAQDSDGNDQTGGEDAEEGETDSHKKKLSETELNQALEALKGQDTYDEESGLKLLDVMEQFKNHMIAGNVDLLALEEGETVTFTAYNPKMLRSSQVEVSSGGWYYYADYGLGSYLTCPFTVKFGSVTATAYCIQPSKPGPGSGVYEITKLGDGKELSKVCYYGTNASGEDCFFDKKYPDFSAGKRFVVTHLAASYAEGSEDAFYGANDTGIALAKELYSYAVSQPEIPDAAMAFSDDKVTAYVDGNIQRTKEVTFQADSRQSITMKLPKGVKFHNVSTGKISNAGADVVVKGGTTFFLSAPLTQTEDVGQNWSAKMKGSITKDYSAYKITTGSDTQNLALVFGEGIEEETTASFQVTWLELAKVQVVKVDSEKEDAKLSGAVFGIYKDKNCTQLIKEMPKTDKNGTASVEIVKTQDTVYLKEITAPTGYRINTSAYNVKLVFYIYIKLADDLQLRRMTSVYEQQLDLCERHQQERELSILRLRDMRHNMKNNLVSILAYAENGDNEKIIRFVNEIMEEGGIKTSTVTNSGNIVIDSLIGYWYVEAKKVGIDFSVNLNIPMEMPFRGADICLILGNLLENAVEAAQKAEGKKYIRLHMKYDKNNLLLFVENNYKGVLIKTKDKRLKSTKTDAENHGVGLSSVYRIAAKYHGVVTIDDDVANRFLIRVVLYGKQE